MGALFHEIFTRPTINALLFFYNVFDTIGVPGAFGLSIIGLTVLVRLLVHPFFRQQAQMAQKMQEMKPHLDKLTKKHKHDKKRLQEEQLKLYRKMGVNPASGCLFAIIQLPIFIALYRVIFQFVGNGKEMVKVIAEINKDVYVAALKVQSLDPSFFGFNLTVAPSQFGKYGAHYLVIPVITAILQYYQVKLASPTAQVEASKKQNKKEEEPDMQTMMSKQMRYMFPVMIGYFAYTLPSALALYWNIFSLFSIFQYRKKA